MKNKSEVTIKDSRTSAYPSITSTYRSFISTQFSSVDLIDAPLTIPPDGGWGWIIVIAAVCVNFLVDGAVYTYGIFKDDIAHSFEVKATQVTYANSIMTGLYFISGPMACAIINRWGFQLCGVIGGLILFTVYLASSWMNSVSLFIPFFGVLGGFGCGLSYVPSIVVVGFYFNRWRSLATSIAATGSALGIIGYPFIIKGLFDSLGWRNQFRIIAAGNFMICLLSLTYKPLKPIYVQIKAEKKAQDVISLVEATETNGFFKRIFRRFHNVTYPTASHVNKDSTILISVGDMVSSSSVFISTTLADESLSSTSKALELVHPSKVDGRMPTEKLSTVFEQDTQSEQSVVFAEEYIPKQGKCAKCCKNCFQWGHKNRPMYRDDIFYTGPSMIPTQSTASGFPGTLAPRLAPSQVSQQDVKSTIEYHLSVSRVAVKGKDTEKVHYKCCPESVIRTLVTMMDISLLKSPSFFLLSLSGMLTIVGMYPPFIYLIQRAKECGISEKKALNFFTALGVANAIGRLISGVIATIPYAKPLVVSYVSLLICGVTILCMHFTCSVVGHFAILSIYALTIACISTLRAPIIVELMGLEVLTNAFGIALVFQSFGAVCAVPIAGLAVEASGQQSGLAFVISGSGIILSAILLIPIKCISEWEKRRKPLDIKDV